MKPIGVIFNPFAYINRKGTEKQLYAIKKALDESALVRITRSKDEVPLALKEFYKEGITILGISGGDGTISSVLSSYISLFDDKDLPIIVPLKGGTMNMVAGDAGLRGSQVGVCHELIRCIKNKRQIPTIERGLIRVIDSRYKYSNYTFSWVDGFLYRFIKWYYREGGGVGVALKLILKSGITALTNLDHDLFKEVESRVYLDGKKLPFESHLFIFAASVKRTVFGFRVFTEEVVPEEKFGMLYMRLPYFGKALYRLPVVLYKGLKSDISGNFINQSLQSLRIEGNRGYIIDGEIYDSDNGIDVRLEAGPKVRIFSFKGGKG
jgi:hypothetical protein